MAESSVTSLGDDNKSAAMLEVATPDLYRINAFRVLGLPVTVSTGDLAKQQKKLKIWLALRRCCGGSGDLAKQQKKLKMLERLGTSTDMAGSEVLPLTPAPDADAIRRAGQRLRDPEVRLVDELFWFWPDDPLGDRGGHALPSLRTAEEVDVACRVWQFQGKFAGKDGSASSHNLAVLHHAQALDLEHAANGDADLNAEFVARRDAHWQAALKHWATSASDQSLWDHIVARIRDLDNPRLTTGVARRMRETLPITVLSISVRLAVRVARSGDTAEARRHLAYIRNSGFDLDQAATIVEREVAPLVGEVGQFCEPIIAHAKAHPEDAADLAQQAIDDTRSLLAGIRAVLSEQHYLRQSASDTVAKAVRTCWIESTDEDWEQWARLLNQAKELALDADLRTRLDEDIAQAQTNRDCESLRGAVLAGDGATARALCEQTQRRSEPASDAMARTIRNCTVDYGNRTEDWEKCLEFLELAQQLAVDAELKSKLDEDVSQVRRNLDARADRTASDLVGKANQALERGDIATAQALLLQAHRTCRDPAYKARIGGWLTVSRVAPPSGRPTPQPASAPWARPVVAVVAIGLIVGLICLGGVLSDSGPKSRTPSRPSYRPSPSYSPPERPSTPSPQLPDVSRFLLSQRIEEGKARARALESKLGQMDAELESLSSRLRQQRSVIEGYERQVGLGIDVNDALYQQALDSHNALVPQHNSLVAERKAKYSEYKREIDSVNDMVRRYNSGER